MVIKASTFGLPVGKSTLAHAVEERLHLQGKRTYVFDGDNVRHGLCGDLGFSMEDRRENLRRISEMTKLFLDSGVISLTAFVSPLAEDRARIRDIIGPDDFIEVYSLLKSTVIALWKSVNNAMLKGSIKRRAKERLKIIPVSLPPMNHRPIRTLN